MSSIFQSKKRKIFGKDNLVRIEASGTWIFFFLNVTVLIQLTDSQLLLRTCKMDEVHSQNIPTGTEDYV